MQELVKGDSFVRENPKLLHVLPGQAPIPSSRSRKPPTHPLYRRQQMDRTMWNQKCLNSQMFWESYVGIGSQA